MAFRLTHKRIATWSSVSSQPGFEPPRGLGGTDRNRRPHSQDNCKMSPVILPQREASTDMKALAAIASAVIRFPPEKSAAKQKLRRLSSLHRVEVIPAFRIHELGPSVVVVSLILLASAGREHRVLQAICRYGPVQV